MYEYVYIPVFVKELKIYYLHFLIPIQV